MILAYSLGNSVTAKVLEYVVLDPDEGHDHSLVRAMPPYPLECIESGDINLDIRLHVEQQPPRPRVA